MVQSIPKERFDKAFRKFQREAMIRLEILQNEPLQKQFKKIIFDFLDEVNGVDDKVQVQNERNFNK